MKVGRLEQLSVHKSKDPGVFVAGAGGISALFGDEEQFSQVKAAAQLQLCQE